MEPRDDMEVDKTFSQAVKALKQGRLIGREDWIKKGMVLYVVDGDYPLAANAPAPKYIEGIHRLFFKRCSLGTPMKLPIFSMFQNDGTSHDNYQLSTADVLADDWCLLY